MTEGNDEQLAWILKWILIYRRYRRTFILSMLQRMDASKQVHIFQSRKQLNAWLETNGLS